jgi:hypothetical protein
MTANPDAGSSEAARLETGVEHITMNRRVAGLHVSVSEPTTLQPTAGFARVVLKSAREARSV